MTPGVLSPFLRWLFWGLVYLGAVLMALVLLMPLSAPVWLKWGMVGVVVWGCAEDAARKVRQG